MTFDPDNPNEHAAKPKRTRVGGIYAMRTDRKPVLDPEVEAEFYERCWGTLKAIEYLERDAGDQRFRHHVLRKAADILRAKWVRGEVRE